MQFSPEDLPEGLQEFPNLKNQNPMQATLNTLFSWNHDSLLTKLIETEAYKQDPEGSEN